MTYVWSNYIRNIPALVYHTKSEGWYYHEKNIKVIKSNGISIGISSNTFRMWG